MKLSTEIVEEKQNALIVIKKEYPFISLLKNELKRVSINPFSSPFIPKNIKMFHFVFIIDESVNLEGNSGPYLQYTFARCKSVLAKSEARSTKHEAFRISDFELGISSSCIAG